MKFKKASIFGISILLLFSCQKTNITTFSSEHKKIDFEKVIRIEFEADLTLNPIQNTEPITEKLEIQNFVSQVNKAKRKSVWKGVHWDKVKFIQEDTTIILRTNGKVVGVGNSGWFYNLSKKSLLAKRYISK